MGVPRWPSALEVRLRGEGVVGRSLAGVQGGGSIRREVSEAMVNFLGIGLKDRKSTRLNSSHKPIAYAVFCLKKKN